VQYMLLIYGDPHEWDAMTQADADAMHGEYFAFTKGIIDSGEYVSGAPLQPVDTATSVRVRDGQRVTTDGPFAETKEVLGGYYIVEVPDLDRALALAAEIPGAQRGLGPIEVRPVQVLPDMPA
jgi:hypothetical protein